MIRYDPKVISLADLAKQASKVQCAQKVYAPDQQSIAALHRASRLKVGVLDKSYRKAKASDQKRQLQGTPGEKVSLSPMQATKVNAWWREDPSSVLAWISPRQGLAKRP